MAALHVFYGLIPDNPDEAQLTRLSQLLTEDEQLKFSFFTRLRPKLHFLFGRLLLRKALDRLGSVVPPELSFSESGQPYFADHPDLSVSLAQSGEMVACALVSGTRAGVDVQEIKPVDWVQYQDSFQPQEWEFIRKNNHPLAAFYQLWARKEAVAKADGAGMGLPFETLDVLQENILVEDHTWNCVDLELGTGYTGALAWDSLAGMKGVRAEQVDLAFGEG